MMDYDLFDTLFHVVESGDSGTSCTSPMRRLLPVLYLALIEVEPLALRRFPPTLEAASIQAT
jgi:hypothetical protein